MTFGSLIPVANARAVRTAEHAPTPRAAMRRRACLRGNASSAEHEEPYRARIAQRNAELDGMLQRGAEARGVDALEEDLRAYLTYCAFNEEIIETDELEPLRRGNRIVNEVRQHLTGGRGNVKTDLARTGHESYQRMRAGRELFRKAISDLSPPTAEKFETVRASCAMEMRAGNCSEYATVAMLFTLPTMGSGETVHKAAGRKHNWSELWLNGARRSNADVIIDPWAAGSSVRREHSAYGRNANKAPPVASFDAGMANAHDDFRRHFSDVIGGDPGYQDLIREKLAVYRDRKLSWLNRWDETPVLNKRFVKRAKGKMKALERAPNRRILRQVAAARTDQPLARDAAQAARYAEELTSNLQALKQARNGRLLQQIVAVGPARQLGANVVQAAQKADEFFPAFRRPVPEARQPRAHPLGLRAVRSLRYIGNLAARASSDAFASHGAFHPFAGRALSKPPG